MYKDLTNAMGGGIYWVGRDELPVCKEVAIERLEAENAALRGQLDKVKKQAWLWKKRFKLEERANEILTEELLNVTAERDAANRDLEDEDSCRVCKYAIDGESCLCEDCIENGEDVDCEKCPWLEDPCGECSSINNKWQWRGPQKEDNGNDD